MQTPALRQFTVATVLAVVAFGFSESVLFAVADADLHRPLAFVCVVSSLQGAGAIAAAAGFLLSTAPSLLAVAPGTMLVGASLPWIVAGVMTLFQRRMPAVLMGRTDAALNVLIGVPQTTAIAAGAVLITLVDYRVMPLVPLSLKRCQSPPVD
ncbi:hypothetical protein [Streptomyces sp. NPDC001980]|uniref:hypothetical protein n=1 Tax=Streptomyces sp. NPDC001980 TaxID=3157126 RepID=UPI0033213703